MDKPKPKVLKKKQQKILGLYGLLERGTVATLRFVGILRQETSNEMCIGDMCLDEATGTIKIMTSFGLVDVG